MPFYLNFSPLFILFGLLGDYVARVGLELDCVRVCSVRKDNGIRCLVRRVRLPWFEGFVVLVLFEVLLRRVRV